MCGPPPENFTALLLQYCIAGKKNTETSRELTVRGREKIEDASWNLALRGAVVRAKLLMYSDVEMFRELIETGRHVGKRGKC
jgi:hypothetical protein